MEASSFVLLVDLHLSLPSRHPSQSPSKPNEEEKEAHPSLNLLLLAEAVLEVASRLDERAGLDRPFDETRRSTGCLVANEEERSS